MSKALQIKGFPQYYITDTGDVYSRVCLGQQDFAGGYRWNRKGAKFK